MYKSFNLLCSIYVQKTLEMFMFCWPESQVSVSSTGCMPQLFSKI
uniref:Uncharacterized protein n=1 Tax=Rhizophora mucronata TaxID=61149 RepID=A0A2P2IZP0_RHIMU